MSMHEVTTKIASNTSRWSLDLMKEFCRPDFESGTLEHPSACNYRGSRAQCSDRACRRLRPGVLSPRLWRWLFRPHVRSNEKLASQARRWLSTAGDTHDSSSAERHSYEHDSDRGGSVLPTGSVLPGVSAFSKTVLGRDRVYNCGADRRFRSSSSANVASIRVECA